MFNISIDTYRIIVIFISRNQCISPPVLSFNPDHREGYSMQFASDSRQVCGFQRLLRFPSTIKLTTTI
jgi:hypothetical protein